MARNDPIDVMMDDSAQIAHVCGVPVAYEVFANADGRRGLSVHWKRFQRDGGVVNMHRIRVADSGLVTQTQ